MKVMIMTNEVNGLYLFRKELIKTLQEFGYQVYVLLPYDKNAYKLEELDCKLYYVPLERRGNNIIHDIRLFHSYCNLLNRIEPAVVFTYTIKPNLYGGLACRIKGIPYLCNITGLGTAIENGGLLSHILLLFYKVSICKAKRIYFQNVRNKDFMNRKGIGCVQGCLLPGSGVNLTEHPYVRYPTEKNGIKILAVLRIMKDKGIEEYLDAVRILTSGKKELSFTLIGDYEEETRAFYEPQIQQMIKKGMLTYLGHVDSVKDVMAQSHIIIHPSYHEGLSNVLLEAAACGRPVLASNICGCIETFIQGESGIAFEPKSAESIVQAVEKILTYSEEKRRQMGIRGREWVEDHFDRNLVIKAYLDEITFLK